MQKGARKALFTDNGTEPNGTVGNRISLLVMVSETRTHPRLCSSDAWKETCRLYSFVLSKLPWPFDRSLEYSPHILASAIARCLSAAALGVSLLLPF
jgi:hypothetical protein